MMQKLATVGYRVAPKYNDAPNGTIVEVLNELYVMVLWDAVTPDSFGWVPPAAVAQDHSPRKEQIKYLRKGLARPASSSSTAPWPAACGATRDFR
jgi:hypothetical protein